MRQQADTHKVDELRGEMRREVEEAGAVPPVGLITKEMEKGLLFGVVVGALIGAVLGAIVAALPILETESLATWVRIAIGVGCGIFFGSVFGTVAGAGLRSEIVEQDRELPAEERRRR